MRPLTILHRDDDLVVVDKPAGMLVVPAPQRSSRTLVDALTQQLGERVMAVHRLDEDTTGALVVALTNSGKDGMEELFRQHTVKREYLALLGAVPSPAAGRIEGRLEEGHDGIVRVVRRGGQSAVTHYETLDRRGRCVLVCCRLETGRRNQIRAHMAALGCPVAGDRKYGFRARPDEHFSGLMLHSWRLGFAHPVTGLKVDVVAEPPDPVLRP